MRRRLGVVLVYGVLTLTVMLMAKNVGVVAAIVATLAIAVAGGANYLLGWHACESQVAGSDSIRDAMRVTPPLEQRHIHALLAFGENSFGPMDLDDDHDEALEVLRKHVRIPVGEDPR